MSMIKSVSWGAASLLAAAVFAGPSFADGMPGRGRVKAPETGTRPCAVSANVGVTTDYVFRGISQSGEDAAIQGGVDLTCGRFYLGVWGSSIDYAGLANVEIDLYGGFKTTTGPINWDIGFIYYAYPGQVSGLNADFFEIKLGASAEIWKGGTLGATVFYSPDGQFDTGPTWTVEGTFSQTLAKVGMFTPTVSATVGNVTVTDFGNLDYTYWNVGLTVSFLERWSLDVRYWDTDIDGCAGGVLSCDSRVVATVKYTF